LTIHGSAPFSLGYTYRRDGQGLADNPLTGWRDPVHREWIDMCHGDPLIDVQECLVRRRERIRCEICRTFTIPTGKLNLLHASAASSHPADGINPVAM
jgi:hypothetical protein